MTSKDRGYWSRIESPGIIYDIYICSVYICIYWLYLNLIFYLQPSDPSTSEIPATKIGTSRLQLFERSRNGSTELSAELSWIFDCACVFFMVFALSCEFFFVWGFGDINIYYSNFNSMDGAFWHCVWRIRWLLRPWNDHTDDQRRPCRVWKPWQWRRCQKIGTFTYTAAMFFRGKRMLWFVALKKEEFNFSLQKTRFLRRTGDKISSINSSTLQGTNISPKNGILKMIFLFPRWDMLIPWRVYNHLPFHILYCRKTTSSAPGGNTLRRCLEGLLRARCPKGPQAGPGGWNEWVGWWKG